MRIGKLSEIIFCNTFLHIPKNSIKNSLDIKKQSILELAKGSLSFVQVHFLPIKDKSNKPILSILSLNSSALILENCSFGLILRLNTILKSPPTTYFLPHLFLHSSNSLHNPLLSSLDPLQ